MRDKKSGETPKYSTKTIEKNIVLIVTDLKILIEKYCRLVNTTLQLLHLKFSNLSVRKMNAFHDT